MASLAKCLAELPDATRAIVLHGESDHFSAGLDLAELRERDAAERIVPIWTYECESGISRVRETRHGWADLEAKTRSEYGVPGFAFPPQSRRIGFTAES